MNIYETRWNQAKPAENTRIYAYSPNTRGKRHHLRYLLYLVGTSCIFSRYPRFVQTKADETRSKNAVLAHGLSSPIVLSKVSFFVWFSLVSSGFRRNHVFLVDVMPFWLLSLPVGHCHVPFIKGDSKGPEKSTRQNSPLVHAPTEVPWGTSEYNTKPDETRWNQMKPDETRYT